MNKTSLAILQITDTHLFAGSDKTLLGVNTEQSLRSVIEAFKSENQEPDIILLTGDLSHDETVASYEKLVMALSDFTCPIYWLPGNHDQPDVLAEVFNRSTFSDEKVIERDDWQIVLLNSYQQNQVPGLLSKPELNFLRDSLQRSEKYQLIALHHPPLPANSVWLAPLGLSNAEEFFTVIDSAPKVKIVLCGHIHQEFVGERNGIHYLASPSTCVQFKPHTKSFAVDILAPGCRLLYLHADGTYTTQIVRAKDFNVEVDGNAVGY